MEKIKQAVTGKSKEERQAEHAAEAHEGRGHHGQPIGSSYTNVGATVGAAGAPVSWAGRTG